jgi:hypothetical protein
MTAITIASFVVGIRYPSGRGSLAFNLIFLSLFAVALAMAIKTAKTGEMCLTANTLRKKLLLEEKGNKPPATSAKREGNKSVNRS